MTFCKGCGKPVEWHPRAVDGRTVSIDPDPHPEGMLAFDGRLRLVAAPVGSRKRMYRYHLTTCAKPPERGTATKHDTCDVEDCERTDRHTHCLRCGATDHWVAECPEEG